jgi:hypothetical protein
VVKKADRGELFQGYVPGGNWVTVGYRFPPGLGEIALEANMMRKTMEKMSEYDIKQWEKNGKFE